MNGFFKELIGITCVISTTQDTYTKYVLKDICDDWVVIENDHESIYLNLAHVVSIRIYQD